jgi:hypothetical protein
MSLSRWEAFRGQRCSLYSTMLGHKLYHMYETKG